MTLDTRHAAPRRAARPVAPADRERGHHAVPGGQVWRRRAAGLRHAGEAGRAGSLGTPRRGSLLSGKLAPAYKPDASRRCSLPTPRCAPTWRPRAGAAATCWRRCSPRKARERRPARRRNVADARLPALSPWHRTAYVCGAEFTLVDVAVATYLAWTPYWTKAAPDWKLAERWPRLAEYVARVMARPAVGPNVPLAWLDDTAAWLL